MTVRRFRLEPFTIAIVGACFLLSPAGCGRGEFGSELSFRPSPQALGGVEGGAIRLPQDKPFSIALAPTQETPGLGGTAEADAHASKDGNADATARVENGGSALAGFQLGHAFENDSDRQMHLHVRVRCEYQTQAGALPSSALPDAQVTLKLYARDGRNRLLRELSLVAHSTDEGAASSTSRKNIEFDLTLGPRQSVSIFLAGSVEIETPDGRSAHGSIGLSGLEMDVRTEMAPPVRKAADEQG